MSNVIPPGLFPLCDVPSLLPASRRPSLQTVQKWVSKGYQGILLDFIQIGRTRYVTGDALTKFLTEITEASKSQTSNTNK